MTRKLVATLKMWSPWRPGARNLCTHHERQILMTVSKYFTGITKKNRDRFQAGIRTLPSTNAYQARQHLILLWRIPTIMCGHSRGYATNSVQWTSQAKTRKRYATSLGDVWGFLLVIQTMIGSPWRREEMAIHGPKFSGLPGDPDYRGTEYRGTTVSSGPFQRIH
jgi:hypothetical protein